MIIVDFVLIFVICLAVTLFSLENTQDIALKILPQFEIQVHLAVAMTCAMGIGAILASIYMTWTKLKNYLEFRGQKRQIKEREKQIQELKQSMESHQAELEKLHQQKLSSSSIAENNNFRDQQYEAKAPANFW